MSITSDFQLFGVICLIVGGVFYTSGLPYRPLVLFYRFMPVMVACYFLPSLLNTFGLIHIPHSHLHHLARDYLMPACLCLMLLGLDMRAILHSGGKLLLLFLIGSFGVFLGGPLALLTVAYFQPDLLQSQGDDSLWRGMATLAANWVGGTANQLAIKQMFHVGDHIFAIFVTINVVLTGIWMATLLMLAPHQARLDRWLGAKPIAIENPSASVAQQIPEIRHWVLLLCLPLMLGAVGHSTAKVAAMWVVGVWPGARDYQLHSPFLWHMAILTTGSVLLSLSPARKLAAYGAEKVGSVCLYLMLAIMGLKMDISMLLSLPWYFVIGIIWLLVHIAVMLLATWGLKLPFSYLAIASQCNLGGAASAPVVAGAYCRPLVPLAVLIAVFGYAWANFVAWACAQWLQRIG